MPEAIAIVGMACNFPGATDIDMFWRLLRDGVDATGVVPAERWDAAALFDPDPAAPARINTMRGGFVANVAEFDPGFFNLYPSEAKRMDPQQKLVLETAWQALEHACIPPSALAATPAGVYMAVSHSDHGRKLHADIDSMDGYEGTNYYHGFVAHRLSYLLNLQGPSLAVDTACSSALSAVHLACQGLRAGDCDLALVGGVNLNLLPGETISASIAGMLSGDGRCKSFDTSADGFGRSEGCGVVVLQRQGDAQNHGRRIFALVRGSAVNHNGLSNGITSPSGLAQQAVIRRALQAAGVQPAQIGYVEAHGTGTVKGDAVEVRAIKQVFGEGRAPGSRCYIGTHKANIGHLETASGISGLIKTVLCMSNAQIPPAINLQELNENIQLADSPFAIPTELTPWKADNGRYLAGVSAFGFGGANCHVVLERPGVAPAETRARRKRPIHVLTLRAKSKHGLRALAARYAALLSSDDAPELADVCHSANVGREAFEFRLAAAARTNAELACRLSSFALHAHGEHLFDGRVAGHRRPKIAFCFAGGADLSYARTLYETSLHFRASVYLQLSMQPEATRCRLLDFLRGKSAAEAFDRGSAAPVVERALAELLESWGIRPAKLLRDKVSIETWLSAPAEAGRACDVVAAGSAVAGHWLVTLGAGAPGVELSGPDTAASVIGHDVWQALGEALGRLYIAGVPVDWAAFDREYGFQLVDLPSYPFERQRSWFVGANLPSDAQLSARLSESRRPPWFDACVVELQKGRSALDAPVFLIHAVDGSVSCYRDLVRQLGAARSIWGLQAPALRKPGLRFQSFEAMADTYSSCMEWLQPEGVIHLAGWSMGGAIAYEVASRLQRSGRPVRVALLDTHVPTPGWVRTAARALIAPFAREMGITLTDTERGELERLETDAGLQRLLVLARRGTVAAIDAQEWAERIDVLRHHLDLFARYKPEAAALTLVLIKAERELDGAHSAAIHPPDLGWGRLVEQVSAYTVCGHHFSLMTAPATMAVAAVLQQTLLAAARADLRGSSAEHREPPALRPDGMARNAQDIERWMLTWLAHRLEVEREALDLTRDFTQLGLNSIALVRFLKELSNWLGAPVSAALVWQCGTPRCLIDTLAGGGATMTEAEANAMEGVL